MTVSNPASSDPFDPLRARLLKGLPDAAPPKPNSPPLLALVPLFMAVAPFSTTAILSASSSATSAVFDFPSAILRFLLACDVSAYVNPVDGSVVVRSFEAATDGELADCGVFRLFEDGILGWRCCAGLVAYSIRRACLSRDSIPPLPLLHDRNSQAKNSCCFRYGCFRPHVSEHRTEISSTSSVSGARARAPPADLHLRERSTAVYF